MSNACRKMLKRKEAAVYLGVAYLTLQYWANSKESKFHIPYSRYGRNAMYDVRDLDAFIDAHRIEATNA